MMFFFFMYNTVTSLFVNDTKLQISDKTNAFYLRFCLRFVLHNWMYSLNKLSIIDTRLWVYMYMYVGMILIYFSRCMKNEAIPELSFPGFLIISLDASVFLAICIKKKISVTMHSNRVLFTNNLISWYAWNLFFFQESYSQSVSTLYSEISPNLYDIKQYFHGGCLYSIIPL